jgi:hypothetical protein
VVTPYRQFGLPKQRALEHILSHASVLFTTFDPGASDRIENFDYWEPLAFEERELFKAEFLSWRADRRFRDTGVCSLIFDDSGNCSPRLEGSAAVVTSLVGGSGTLSH